VLLANPRWERRLVKFLELSGVGRTMTDGTDEEGAHAARMDEWVVWETVEGAAPGARPKPAILMVAVWGVVGGYFVRLAIIYVDSCECY
jgi:hypothetical protein